MIRTLAVTATLVGLAACVLVPPVHAADKPTSTDATEQVYVVTDTTECYETPDASYSGKESVLHPAVGTAYRATPARYRGIGGGRGDTTFRWLIVSGKRGCYIPAHWTSSDVTGLLDPSTWTLYGIVAPADGAGAIGALLQRNDKTLFSAPAISAVKVGEVEDAEVLRLGSATVEGEAVMTGTSTWRPVERDGVVAWLRSSSIVEVPAPAEEDLTSSLTPSRSVPVSTLPGAGQHLTDLQPGVQVPAGASPVLGWVPVAVNGQVGWVSQRDLLATPSETAAPTESASSSADGTKPGLSEQVAAEWEEWKADREQKRAEREASGEPSLIERLKQTTTRDNPVAQAAAKAALYLSGGIAALALVLAFLGHLALGRGGQKSSAAKALGMLARPEMTLIKGALIPGSLVLGGLAAVLAPASHFPGLVLLGAVPLGLVLGFVSANAVAAVRGADRSALWERERLVGLVFAAGACALGAHMWRSDLPLSVLVAFVSAGFLAGVLAPKFSVPDVSASASPRTPSGDGAAVQPPRPEPATEEVW